MNKKEALKVHDMWVAVQRAISDLKEFSFLAVLSRLEHISSDFADPKTRQPSPCACGGRKPIAEWDGWMGGNQTGGYPLAKVRYHESDVPVHVAVFALPTEETDEVQAKG